MNPVSGAGGGAIEQVMALRKQIIDRSSVLQELHQDKAAATNEARAARCQASSSTAPSPRVSPHLDCSWEKHRSIAQMPLVYDREGSPSCRTVGADKILYNGTAVEQALTR